MADITIPAMDPYFRACGNPWIPVHPICATTSTQKLSSSEPHTEAQNHHCRCKSVTPLPATPASKFRDVPRPMSGARRPATILSIVLPDGGDIMPPLHRGGTMPQDEQSAELLQLTTTIVAAHLSHNPIAAAELPGLIATVHQALATVGTEEAVG